MTAIRARNLLPTLLGLASSCAIGADHDVPVTPQRPSLSSDTATTAPGTLELEAGVGWDPDERIDTPVTLKVGVSPEAEVFMGGSVLSIVDQPGAGDELGIGDLVLGYRHRFLDEAAARPSVALQGSLTFPTGDEDEEMGSGELGGSLAGIAMKGSGPTVFVGYYALSLAGDPSGDGSVMGSDIALSCATSWTDGIGAYAEVAGVLVPELDTEPVFTTLGLTWFLRPSLAYDVGIVVGLNDDAPDFQLVFGFTQNLGRLVRGVGR